MDKQHLKEEELRVQNQQALVEHQMTKNEVTLAQTVGKYQLPEASKFCGRGFQKEVTIN